MSRPLNVKDLKVSLDRPPKTIVEGVSVAVDEGEWLMIIGPNGAGKSTIVKAISGIFSYEGSILCEGEEVKKIRPVRLARKMGVLAQTSAVGYSFTVREVVSMGRYSHSPSIFSIKPQNEDEIIEKAIVNAGLSGLESQSVLTLSGGELQRVFLAQLFAQDPDILVLDEPSNHLDLVYQKQIFELIRNWLKEKEGRCVISVVHDLTLAKVYGTKALLLDQGKQIAFGDPDKVFDPSLLEKVYGMDVHAWMQNLLSVWHQS